MMNILLVDDNRYVLEGIKAGIDFRKLGIENVFQHRKQKKSFGRLKLTSFFLILRCRRKAG